MVSVFTGLGVGFERSSAAQIGAGGVLGGGTQGRGGDRISVNAANGNLLINRQDEFLIARGLDVGISRTYNSHGHTDGEDNNDRWRQNTDRRIRNSTGTPNTNGATVSRVSGDGSEIVYTYKTLDGVAAYWTDEGGGSHDKITFSGSIWTWEDGDTGVLEKYFGAGTRIREQIDQDGNKIEFEYHSDGRLKNLKTADGSEVHYTYGGLGQNIQSIITKVGNDQDGFQFLTRTYYEYDGSDRLIKVVTDLTPDDNTVQTTGSGSALAAVEHESYVTTYSYYGSTNLVASIEQTDGSKVEFSYDGLWRVTRIQQHVAENDIRDTRIGYASNVTSVTDPSGSITKLYHDDKGQLVQLVAPPSEAGGTSQVIQYEYDGSGNLLRTINSDSVMAHNPNNLIDTSDWGEGELARRAENLINDSGWPTDIDSVPSGTATIDGWLNNYTYHTEASWTTTTGPYGEQIVSMHAGQTDTDGAGGGGVTNGFDIDISKTYEFTYYFKADELNKHRTYFGLYANGGLRHGHSDGDTTNPYFQHLIPSAAAGLQAGKWYKVVAYVLPDSQGVEAQGSYGGIYDLETGEKTASVNHFRWKAENAGHDAHSRFFNHYETQHQGKFTHFYKPEVREVSNAALLKTIPGISDSRLDVARDAALLNAQHIEGWNNWSGVARDGEARWTEIDGPEGSRIVALETGQFDAGSTGGGNLTNEFTIDGSKTYKYTQYVRKSDLSRHYLYAGLQGSYVKDAHTGNVNTNPYFYSVSDATQRNTLNEGEWYKIVGYVLAEGSANQSYGSLGGIYNAQTGERVADTRTFRWNESRPDDSLYARFFGFYDQLEHGWSTQWAAPEFVEVDAADLTQDNANPFGIIYDEAGEITSYTYNANGDVTTITDALGNVTTHTYNSENNLVRTLYKASTAASYDEWILEHYIYDGEGHLRYMIDGNQGVTEYRYEAAGNRTYEIQYTQHKYARTWDLQSLSTLDGWRNGLNRTESQLTRHLYDARGNRYRTINYADTTSNGSASTATQGYTDLHYTYDSAGRLLSSKTTRDVGSTYSYDGLGRQISTTNIHGGTTTILFEDTSNQTVITTDNGGATTSVYNKAGQLISRTISGDVDASGTSTHEYDKNGRLRITKDAAGGRTYFVYDNAGNLTAEVDNTGFVQEFKYDDDGRQIAHARYASYKTSTERNIMLAQLSNPNNTLAAEDLRKFADPAANNHWLDIWNWTAYDQRGQVSRTVLGDGSVTAYEYDKAGRLIKTIGFVNKLNSAQRAELRAGTAAADTYLPVANAAEDIVNRTFYNRAGQIIGTMDGSGGLTKHTYDAAGRKIQEESYANFVPLAYRDGTFNSAVNAIPKNTSTDILTSYVYDGQGHLRYTIAPQGRVTEFIYGTGSAEIGLVRQTIEFAQNLSTQSDLSYTNINSIMASRRGNVENRETWNVYNTRQQLSYVINADDSVQHFQYDNQGNVTAQFDFSERRPTDNLPSIGQMNTFYANNWNTARITRMYYNGQNQLRYVVDAEGYVTQNLYNSRGDIQYERRYANQLSLQQYDTYGEIQTVNKGSYSQTQFSYQANGALSSVYDANGTRRLYTYFANGELAWDIENYGSINESRMLHYNDTAGRKYVTRSIQGSYIDSSDENYRKHRGTRFYYDGAGQLIRSREYVGDHSDGGLDQNTYFEYDKAGNLIKQTNAEGGVTEFEYNAFGQVTKTTDPRGNDSYNFYNRAGQLTTSVDAEGYLTHRTFNSFGEVETETRRALKVQSTIPLVSDTNAADSTTTFFYDDLGRVTETRDANGDSEFVKYNAFGQIEETTNKSGGKTFYEYDKRGLLEETRVIADVYNNSGTLIASEIKTTYEYDSRGNQILVIEADGRDEARTTNYVYDAADRLIQKSGEAVSVYTFGTDGGASTVTPTENYTYDRRGNLIESEDANGGRTLYYYDKMDRVTHQISAEGTLVRNWYDANSNLIKTRVYETKETLPDDATGAPPSGGAVYRETEFTYDRLNRMTDSYVNDVQTARFDGTLTLTAYPLHTNYTYDANGNVIKVTDPNGGETTSQYDHLNRKTQQVDAAGFVTEWVYDSYGNVKRETRFATNGDANRITEYGYNKLGQRTIEVRRDVLVFDGNGEALYNVSGVNQNYAGTSVVKRNGDSAISYNYNALGQVTKKTEATGDYITYNYDAQGRMMSEVRSGYTDHLENSVSPKISYYYNALGDLAGTKNYGITGSISDADTKFNYDASGRLESKTEAEGLVRHYAYDAKGQLVRESYTREGNEEGIGYEYDLEGRVISQGAIKKVGNNWTRAGLTEVETRYNAFGDVSERGVNGVFSETFDYDNAGRVWRSTAGDGTYKYFFYDANGNQTVSIASDGLNIDNKSIDQIIDIWDTRAIFDFNRLSTTYKDGINVTIIQYDARNLATHVHEPERESHNAAGTLSRSDLLTTRSYNAFGDVISESDAAGNTIEYKYNTMGRRIETKSPEVSITNADGTTDDIRPTEHMYYDVSGRLVANRDANGNLTRQELLTGTGYGGTQALVTKVHNVLSNGSVYATVETEYDIHGNARKTTDQLGRVTTQTVDRLGRVTRIDHAGGLIDEIRYDALGQKIEAWNNVGGYQNSHFETNGFWDRGGLTSGSNLKALTSYDAEGRVISQTARGGDVTSYSYAWDGSLATAGLATGSNAFGGWTQTTTYANNKTLTVKSDIFGRQTYKNDLGGHVSNFTYNKGGQLTSSTGTSYSYLNTGKVKTTTVTDGNKVASYEYDTVGNLTGEGLTIGGITYKNASATYDALGRLLTWSDTGTSSVLTVPDADVAYEYDAQGNIRKTVKNFKSIATNGSQTTKSETSWFAFDSLNRLVIDRGALVAGEIVLDDDPDDSTPGTGTLIAYDKAGRRAFTLQSFRATALITVEEYEDYNSGDDSETYEESFSYISQKREDYIYNEAGQLAEVLTGRSVLNWHYVNIQETDDGDTWEWSADVVIDGVTNPTAATGTTTAEYQYDKMGRQIHEVNGRFTTTKLYNGKGQVIRSTMVNRIPGHGNNTASQTYYLYRGENIVWSGNTPRIDSNSGTDGEYALGQATLTWTHNQTTSYNYSTHQYETEHHNPSEQSFSYDWYDGASVNQTSYYKDVHDRGSNDVDTTIHHRDNHGTLERAQINDGRPRNVYYKTDIAGQVITRNEILPDAGKHDPKEVRYRFGGREMGFTGNNGDLNSFDYNDSTLDRAKRPSTASHADAEYHGVFRHQSNSGASRADFDNSYERLNSYNQGSGSGTYTVRGGESLQSIASGLYGDSSLWYKIAQVNGLAGDAALIQGTTLNLPAGVTRNSFNANSVTPYNPGEAIGDTAPTAPEPPKDPNSCGVVGAVIVSVIAVVVTAIVAPYAVAAVGKVAGGAIAAATGSIVSQGVGVATNIQDKFSWKQVGLAAISGGVNGAGFGKAVAGGIKNTALSRFVEGAANSALTQGIGVATGLQKSFSWAGVAAAGVGNVAGGYVGDRLGANPLSGKDADLSLSNIGANLAVGAARSIANAATRSAIDGTQFGDNLRAAIPDVIGQTLGDALGGAITGDREVNISGLGRAIDGAVGAVLDPIAGAINSGLHRSYAAIDRALSNPSQQVNNTNIAQQAAVAGSHYRAGIGLEGSGSGLSAYDYTGSSETLSAEEMQNAAFYNGATLTVDENGNDVVTYSFRKSGDPIASAILNNQIDASQRQIIDLMEASQLPIISDISEWTNIAIDYQNGEIGKAGVIGLGLLALIPFHKQIGKGIDAIGKKLGEGLSAVRRKSGEIFDGMKKVANRAIRKGLLRAKLGRVPSEFRSKVTDALNSSIPGDQFEAETAIELGSRLTGFKRSIGSSIGELDSETVSTIVESKIGKNINHRSIRQLKRLLDDRLVNPNLKPVVLHAPNLSSAAIARLQRNGIYSRIHHVKTSQNLRNVVDAFGG